MLNIYISYAPGDRKTLEKLLKWLRPLEEKYFLRVWFDPPPAPPRRLPLIWQLLLFWAPPSFRRTPYHPDLPQKVREGHIYLFLTSYHALSTPHIDQLEIPAAVERSVLFGPDLVRIFPVLVAPSQWKKYSRLAGFPVLGPEATLAKVSPEEDAYQALVDQLEEAVVALRQNWLEEHRRTGLPTDDFFRPAPPPLPEPEPTPLPGWAGWVILLAILYMVTAWYTNYCAPRVYHKVRREGFPFEDRPRPYYREYPPEPADTSLLPPQDEPDTPLRPSRYQ